MKIIELLDCTLINESPPLAKKELSNTSNKMIPEIKRNEQKNEIKETYSVGRKANRELKMEP